MIAAVSAAQAQRAGVKGLDRSADQGPCRGLALPPPEIRKNGSLRLALEPSLGVVGRLSVADAVEDHSRAAS